MPIFGAKQRFCRLALQDPEKAQEFIGFLREHRPLQKKMADFISHAANAGRWLNAPLVIEDTLVVPIIESPDLKPSKEWEKQLAKLRVLFISYQQQNQISLKKETFKYFLEVLENFKKQTLIESRGWREYYLKAIDKWQEVGTEQLNQLDLQTQQEEPITSNVYVAGEALQPDHNQAIFIGRQDLKDKFSRKILTSQQMPLFLIQGQRRTGKTSLLNFLSPLLGTGFKVIHQDLQDARISNVSTWLDDCRRRVSSQLDIPFEQKQSRGNWLDDWSFMQDWLTTLSENQDYKLILAFDEYEELHDFLSKQPEKGSQLLGAMRSFSQQQNKVVFLFVGSAFFSELKKPNWSDYFVQAQNFQVDYLTQQESIRLITEPVKLIYPDSISQQMFELTQGHPTLLQVLCEKMVNIANKDGKKDMDQADLDSIVHKVVSDRNHSTLSVFWGQFCKEPACKKTVREILNQQEITDKQQFYRLEDHRFIIELEGVWQIRVPLFKQWLQRFSDRE